MTTPNQATMPRWERPFVIGIFTAYVIIAVGFSMGPILEGWDEAGHYRVTYEMIRQGGVPGPFTEPPGEFQQTPLYYALMIPPTLLVGAPDILPDEFRVNPYYGFAWEIASSDNKNVYIHRAGERFPYTGHSVALAIHLLRLTSVILNGASLWLFYLVFRQMWPDRPDRRIAALGVAAFWPVFDSLSGLISNDNLAIFLSVLALYLLILKPSQGFSWRWAAGLGFVLGGGLITKTNLAFLAVPTGAVLLIDRKSWKAVPVILVIVVVLSGWYYVGNTLEYGDPTGMVVFEQLFPTWVTPRDQITIIVVIQRLVYMYLTVWSRFGFNVIGVDWPINLFFGLLTAITFLTLPLRLFQLVQRWRSGRLNLEAARPTLIIITFLLGMILVIFYGLIQPIQLIQGRYILPALPALAGALVVSVDTWLHPKIRQTALLSLAPVSALIALVCLFGYYLPAFRLEPAPAQVNNRLEIRYGDAAELVGVQEQTISARPGEAARLTLVWRAIAPTDGNLLVFIDAGVLERSSLPGAGKLYSSEWLAGQTWSETYVIPIPLDAEPGTYPIRIVLAEGDAEPGFEVVATLVVR